MRACVRVCVCALAEDCLKKLNYAKVDITHLQSMDLTVNLPELLIILHDYINGTIVAETFV